MVHTIWWFLCYLAEVGVSLIRLLQLFDGHADGAGFVAFFRRTIIRIAVVFAACAGAAFHDTALRRGLALTSFSPTLLVGLGLVIMVVSGGDEECGRFLALLGELDLTLTRS